jgi:hypothetical protein
VRVLLPAILLCVVRATCGAQPAPQFTWQGEVDGIVILHLRGKRVDIEYREGQPVERQTFHYRTPLTDVNQNLRLEVREGRGSVRITQQPKLDNNYTASVAIEDRQDGASLYSIALYWDEAATPSGRMDRLVWSGTVEGETIVSCRANHCESKAEGGPTAGREKTKFTRPLPDGDVTVSLDETTGRAGIRLLEQPTAGNQYTARVQVTAMPGGGDCSFTLSWPRPRPPRR